jgi:hypothetical protein
MRNHAGRLLVPIFSVAAFLKFFLDGRDGLQKELAVVGEGESFLARATAGELVNEEFAENDV